MNKKDIIKPKREICPRKKGDSKGVFPKSNKKVANVTTSLAIKGKKLLTTKKIPKEIPKVVSNKLKVEEADPSTLKSVLLSRKINPKSKSLNEVLHTEAILEVLQTEEKDYSVEEISNKSKLSSASVYIWICSVGKKMKEVKKVGVGLYKYQAPN